MNSRIGDILKDDIRQQFGIRACNACVEMARRLNGMTPDEVLSAQNELAVELHRNAQQHPQLFVRLLDFANYALFGTARYAAMIAEAANKSRTNIATTVVAEPNAIADIPQPPPSDLEQQLWAAHAARRTRAKSKRVEARRPARIAIPTLGDNVVVLDADRHGFGDLLTTAWISEGSKGADRRLVHFATGNKAELLAMFNQEVLPIPADLMATTHQAYRKEQTLAQTGDRTPGMRLAQRAKYLGIDATPRRPSATIEGKYRRWAEREIAADTVLLFPQTAYSSREWSADNWLRLARFLEADHVPVRVFLGKADDRFNRFGAIVNAVWPAVGAAMLRAALVVGNDSGPVHLAGNLDVPALAILGPTIAPWVFGHIPSVRTISATKDQMPCVGCCYGTPWNDDCERSCAALQALPVEDVLTKVLYLARIRHHEQRGDSDD